LYSPEKFVVLGTSCLSLFATASIQILRESGDFITTPHSHQHAVTSMMAKPVREYSDLLLSSHLEDRDRSWPAPRPADSHESEILYDNITSGNIALVQAPFTNRDIETRSFLATDHVSFFLLIVSTDLVYRTSYSLDDRLTSLSTLTTTVEAHDTSTPDSTLQPRLTRHPAMPAAATNSNNVPALNIHNMPFTASSSPPRPSPVSRTNSGLPLPKYPTPPPPWAAEQQPNGTLPNGTSPVVGGGKTSQVIEKLTTENDRLRRELRAERAAKEDAVQEAQAMKARITYLEEQNSTITYQYDTNEQALARKERRIDDLRLVVEEEARRRKRAEDQSSEMGKKLGETVAEASREVAEAKEARKMAELQCEMLQREYNTLDGRMASLKQEWEGWEKKIDEEREKHRRELCQLEVVLDQQRQHQEKSDKTVAEMAEIIQGYRATEENMKRLEMEMATVVMEMRWVMRLHKGREGQEAERP
jgi:hypothetical protein